MVPFQDVEVVKMDDFKYLWLTIETTGECCREVKKRVQGGRVQWVDIGDRSNL